MVHELKTENHQERLHAEPPRNYVAIEKHLKRIQLRQLLLLPNVAERIV